MKIITFAQYQWSDKAGAYILVRENSYDYFGKLAECKGPTDDQKSLSASQTAFYNTLTNDYNTQFANQANILKSLQTSLQPVVDAGVNQFGFSPGETQALNSQAIQGTAQQYKNAQKSLQNQQAAQGGGNMALPSGVAAQNKEALAAAGADQTSSQLLGIQQAGYDQGRQNYLSAISSLGGVASTYNPTSYAGATTSAGSAAASEANTIQQAQQASSPWNTIGGILGGVAGSFLNPVGGTIKNLIKPTGSSIVPSAFEPSYGS
jgi:hypothetical protein